jgi:hypothetical protein
LKSRADCRKSTFSPPAADRGDARALPFLAAAQTAQRTTNNADGESAMETRASRYAALAFAGAVALATPALAHDDDHHHPAADPAVVKARQHFFGAENVSERTGRVDKDKVIFSWFGVQSFAVAARGRVFLMDSYIYRLAATRAYVPATVQDLVDLKPEAIFIGHGHGDHADNAAFISVRTGAKIFGAAEHCDAMRGDAVRIFGAGTTVDCTSITTAGSIPGAEVRSLSVLKPDLCITAFKHIHSASVPTDPTLPPNPINPIRDSQERINALFPQPLLNPNPYRTVAGVGGPISIFYQFTVADSDFTFAWHDTGGPLKELAPQLIPLLEGLPKTDVELGSLVSIGEANNGVRDIAMYIDLLRPKIFVGGHTDNFNIGASMFYEQALVRQFGIFNMPPDEQPELRTMHDPYNYVKPSLLTFDYKDPFWQDGPRKKHRARCGGR